MAVLRSILGAAVLALLTAAPASGAEPVDCWTLDGERLEEVQRLGQCQDAFARNGLPPEAMPPPPARKPAVPPPQTARNKPKRQSVLTARGRHSAGGSSALEARRDRRWGPAVPPSPASPSRR